jgi:hypothetical protein
MKIPAIVARLRRLGATPFQSCALLTMMDEGHLKPLLDATVAAFTDVEIGSYPAWYGAPYRTKLTFDGRDRARVEAARADLEAKIAPADVVGRDG